VLFKIPDSPVTTGELAVILLLAVTDTSLNA